MAQLNAHAKINLALVVGPQRPNGKHAVLTVMQRLDLADSVAVEPAATITVEGFEEDTLVRNALEALAARAGEARAWRAAITKRIPVAAGLGGGSSDAAATIRLANATLSRPLAAAALETLAADLGADVPFFLREGPQLGSGDGSDLAPVTLPQDYTVVLVIPHGIRKESTAAVYEQFDDRGGADGFDERCRALSVVLGAVDLAEDLAGLPANDLASSPIAARLGLLGAFRADVTGAGPTVYGLFRDPAAATVAAQELGDVGATVVTTPTW